MLTCAEMTELITEYLEETMSLEDRLEFQKHVGLCRDCREYLHQMKVTVETLGAMPEEPVPEPVMGELLHKFRGWKDRLGEAAAPANSGSDEDAGG